MKTRSFVLLAAIAAASSAHAAVLVSFDMSTVTGSGAARSVSVTTVADGLSSTGLLKNNILPGSPATLGNYGAPATAWGTTVGQASLDVAVTLQNANYLYFTVTPLEGQRITIDSISFGAGAGGTNLRSFYLLSDATGYDASSVLISGTTNDTLLRRSAGVLGSYSLTLTDPEFTNITSSTTFRFYIQSALSDQDVDFGAITLHGSVSAIPEPSAFAFIAAAGVLGLAASRRRLA